MNDAHCCALSLAVSFVEEPRVGQMVLPRRAGICNDTCNVVAHVGAELDPDVLGNVELSLETDAARNTSRVDVIKQFVNHRLQL